MGVEYSAVVAIGKTFYSKSEAQDFLERHGLLNDEDFEEIDEYGLSEWLYNNNKVEGECLNAYSGDYWYVGYAIFCGSPQEFKDTFDSGMENWNSHFPSVEPDIIKTVKVY